MPDGQEKRKDLDTLAEMLLVIQQELYRIVTNRRLFVRDSQELLLRVWGEIEAIIARVIGLLRQGEVEWTALENTGLTGTMLQVKYALLMQARQEAARVPFADVLIPGGSLRGRRGRDRLFQLMNSFLGSLAKALPILEPVKEYKEIVEGSIR
jgi:hypothetical protein